jgi:hypothetical protein
MIMTQGNLPALLERPLVAAFLLLGVISLAVPIVLARLRARGKPLELEQEVS